MTQAHPQCDQGPEGPCVDLAHLAGQCSAARVDHHLKAALQLGGGLALQRHVLAARMVVVQTSYNHTHHAILLCNLLVECRCTCTLCGWWCMLTSSTDVHLPAR